MAEETEGQNDTSTDGQSQSEGTLLTGKEEAKQESTDAEAGKTEEGSQEGQEGEGSSEVPESYEFKLPEGMEIDNTLADKAGPVFKDLGLTQAQADKLTSMFAEHMMSSTTAQAEEFIKEREGWVETIRTDPSIGGDKLEENAGIAARAIDAFGTPELKAMLNKTGYGNHPELFKFALAVGKTIKEDQPGTGDNAAQEKPLEDKLYSGTTPDQRVG